MQGSQISLVAILATLSIFVKSKMAAITAFEFTFLSILILFVYNIDEYLQIGILGV